MAVKKYKPVTPGTRGMTGSSFEEITKSKPERSLLLPLRKSGGRNSMCAALSSRLSGSSLQFSSKVWAQ